jgi:hypothetical protein
MRKVGDKVKIKNLDWYEKNKNEKGDVPIKPSFFIQGMEKYCGTEVTIKEIVKDGRYEIEEDSGDHHWTEYMFEQNIKHEPHPVFDNKKILGKNDVVKVETLEQLQAVIDWLNSELNGNWSCPKDAFENGDKYFNFYFIGKIFYRVSWLENQEFGNIGSINRVILYKDLLLTPTTQPSEQENTATRKPIEDLPPKDTSQDIYFAKKADKDKLRYDLIEDLPYIDCVLPFDDATPSNLDNQTLNSIISDCLFILGSRQNFLKELAKVYTYGCEKYSERSWQTVDNGKDRYTAALFRHIDAYQNGQWGNWEDGNCLHVAQIAWNAIAVKWFINNKGD